MMHGTLKEDIKEALIKERTRLLAIDILKRSNEEETRLSTVIQFIKEINSSTEQHPSFLKIENPFLKPLNL